MRSIAKVALAAAMITAALPFGNALRGQESKSAPGAPPSEIKRSEESPFGGPPPPMRRGATARGTKCATASGTCTIDPAQALGARCECAGAGGQKAQGKVEQ
jgi:hypothetical protein